MPKPPFMNLLITMSSEPQRDVNGTAIQTFGAKWSERDLRASILVGVSLLKYFETCEGSLAWMTFSATKASAKNTVLKVARLAKQTANNVLQLTLLASQDKAWRKSPCVLRPSKKPKVSLMAQISLCVCGVSYARASSASSAAYYCPSWSPVCRSSQLMFCPQEITVLLMLVVVVVVLVAAAPELTARMRQANTTDLSAMALPTPQKKRPWVVWGNTSQNSYGRT